MDAHSSGFFQYIRYVELCCGGSGDIKPEERQRISTSEGAYSPSFSRCDTNCFMAGGCNLPVFGSARAELLIEQHTVYGAIMKHIPAVSTIDRSRIQREHPMKLGPRKKQLRP